MIKDWTIQEELRLKQIYETATKEELIAEFNTGWEKIKNKAQKIGGLNRQKCKVDELKLIADYINGIPIIKLWTKYNISNPTLLSILRKNCVTKRNNNLTNINKEQFKIDYDKLTIQKMVDKYNVSRPTIREFAKSLNLTRPSVFLYKQPKLLDYEDEICNKYVTLNTSMVILAKEYKVNPVTIFHTLHKHNVKIKEGVYGATQKSIGDWLKTSTNLDFISDRIILEGKEIDLYNDNVKTGIEYCGLHWHNEHSHQPKLQNYHYDKYIKAKEKGVHLITIFEDEWLNRNEQVKGALLSILGKNTRRLYARKCNVKLIDKLTGNKFYNDYHIQGQSNLSKWFAGLYYEDELIGVLSFGLHHRDTSKYTLDRLCFKTNVSVAGGTSKLFKFLIEQSKLTNLISWSDNRWFQGKVYEKLGFVKEMDMKPDYSYVDNNKLGIRLSKQSQKKSNTKCPSNLTEKEWCTQRGLYRIWDCGKTRWIWSR